jgi:hypothetical protein
LYDVVFAEDHHKPTMGFVFRPFVNDARSAASSKGMPNVRIVLESIVSECSVQEEIETGIGSVIDEAVAALTKPLTAEEKSPQPVAVENPSRIIFKGSLEEVNRFFYKRGWTDGLPVMPPTEEAVAEMLTGTDLPPDHIVATLVPRLGKATVEKIAINAVMAGALPTYMPLLIAGVKAMLNNQSADKMAVSTGSWAPFWIINGPVRQDILANSGFGAMSPGDIANAAIGRTLGLITKNLRGIRKGMEDMGVLGNPGKYSMVAAENEEDSPWEPLHVEYGFKKEESTISLSFPQSFSQHSPYGTDVAGLLDTIIYDITPVRFGILGIIITPYNAWTLAKAGWTKKQLKDYILENARVPRSHYFTSPNREGPLPRDPNASVAIMSAYRFSDAIRIYVFGGQGTWMGLLSGGSSATTEKVDLPVNWNKLVQKYRNIVPNYIRY